MKRVKCIENYRKDTLQMHAFAVYCLMIGLVNEKQYNISHNCFLYKVLTGILKHTIYVCVYGVLCNVIMYYAIASSM